MIESCLDNQKDRIVKAYAGKITINSEQNIEHKFHTSLLFKFLYENCGRKLIGYETTLAPRSFMRKQGELHWDFGMKGDNRFIIYSIKTKKGSKLSIINKLLSEAEKVAKIKAVEDIYGYTHIFSYDLLRKYGWERKDLTLHSPYRKSVSL